MKHTWPRVSQPSEHDKLDKSREIILKVASIALKLSEANGVENVPF